MIPHRTAFQPKQDKTPLDINLDKIIQISQIKMKEFISQKERVRAETNLLIGKNELIKEEIEHIQNQIQERKSMLDSLNVQFQRKEEEIAEVQGNIKRKLEDFKTNEGNFKHEINQVNYKLDSIKDGTIAESSSQKVEVKKKCEELLEVQEEIALLKDKLYRVNLELSTYETAQRYSNLNVQTNAIKAKNGLEIISQLYQKHSKENQKTSE